MEENVIINRESGRIRDRADADSIIRGLEETRKHWDNRIAFGGGAGRPTLDTLCSIFHGMTLDILERYLARRRRKFSDKSADGIPYQIYEVPKNGRRLVGSVLEVSCERYYQIYMETDEGVAILRCGEYTGSGRATEILNLTREESQEPPRFRPDPAYRHTNRII